jgi:membrane-associated phospholipid phosphatase
MSACPLRLVRLHLIAGIVLHLILSAILPPSRALADARGQRVAEYLSGPGTYLFLGLGVGLPLLEDGRFRKKHAVRALDALTTAALFSEGLKRLTREKRPDTGQHNSFPSGHATGAFAVAAMESAFHPNQAAFWYAGSTLIAASRVRLHRHFLHDVIAGAALGYFTARWELSQPRGLLLAPFIGPRRHGMALQFHKGF